MRYLSLVSFTFSAACYYVILPRTFAAIESPFAVCLLMRPLLLFDDTPRYWLLLLVVDYVYGYDEFTIPMFVLLMPLFAFNVCHTPRRLSPSTMPILFIGGLLMLFDTLLRRWLALIVCLLRRHFIFTSCRKPPRRAPFVTIYLCR